VPIGIVAGFITWSIFHKRETQTRKLPIDTVGLALLVIAVTAIQMMLDLGKELDWFHSNEIIALTVLSVVAFAFLIVWELTDDHPVVDLKLFKVRNFLTGTIAMSIAYGLFMGNIVLLPLWLQSFMGYTATQAGMLMAPVGLFAIILSPIIGKNITKFDTRRLATLAFLVFALVLWMRSHFSTLSDFNTMMIPTLIQGIALALFFIPLTSIILGGLPGDKIASASGLSSFCRVLFGSFGTSISVTVWQDRTTLHHAQLTEMINRGSTASNSALAGLNASGLSTEQALSQINRMIDQQAATLAANDVFYASAVIFVLLIPLVWLSRPAKGGAGASEAAAGAH
jgi:DHA2 family multidrug resistance protein